MTAAVSKYCIENVLAAIRLQEAELQAQQDALIAERLAIAFSLGLNIDDKQAFEDTTLQVGSEAPVIDDLPQLAGQLAELRAAAGQLVAESLQESLAEQERAVADSEAVAAALQAQERWHAQVAQHDAAFARKLARVDNSTWEEIGDQMQEPLNLPMPTGGAAAMPAGPANGPPRLQPVTIIPRSSCQAAQRTSPTPHPTNQFPSGSGSGAGPSRPPGQSTPSAGAGPSSQSQRSAGPSRGTVNCLSCFDTFSDTQVTCAGADSASSSTASAGCGHYFCPSCLSEYVRGAVRDRKFPIGCPMAPPAGGGAAGGRQQQQQAQGGCKAKFSRDSVLAVLQGHPKELQSYQLLEAQSSLEPGQLVYCPHKACSSPLLLAEQDLPPNQPATCPACGKGFCPRCKVPGWHQGYTCAAFQALPAHLRSAEDAAVLQLSSRQQWKRCPQCKEMVERSYGCNHVRCRCGADFCYACGKPYKDNRPTPDNAHGTPACGCQLFDVPADVAEAEEEDEGGAAAGGAAGAAQPARALPRVGALPRRRPFRGGRFVSHTRCRFSSSIYDCPQGPGKCWFWHDEDDEGWESDDE